MAYDIKRTSPSANDGKPIGRPMQRVLAVGAGCTNVPPWEMQRAGRTFGKKEYRRAVGKWMAQTGWLRNQMKKRQKLNEFAARPKDMTPRLVKQPK